MRKKEGISESRKIFMLVDVSSGIPLTLLSTKKLRGADRRIVLE
jgi:hypothetical protein